jgi:hypothetical protein
MGNYVSFFFLCRQLYYMLKDVSNEQHVSKYIFLFIFGVLFLLFDGSSGVCRKRYTVSNEL